jgi:hypothetical protein
MLEAQRRFETLSHGDRKREQLVHLQTFVRQLAETPQGRGELEQRARRLGSCYPREGEDATSYYGRLRSWLDEDLVTPAGAEIRRGRG